MKYFIFCVIFATLTIAGPVRNGFTDPEDVIPGITDLYETFNVNNETRKVVNK